MGKAKRGVRRTKSASSGKNSKHSRQDTSSYASSSLADKDPFHNGERPACQLLARACQDVFPELRTDDALSNMNSQDDDDTTQYRTNNSQPASNGVAGSSADNSSLLGQMIRWHMIQKRKDVIRKHFDLITGTQGGDGASTIVTASVHGLAPEPESAQDTQPAATKKKRKKKRKKKGGGGAGGSAPLQGTTLDIKQQDDTSLTGTFGTFDTDDWSDNKSNPQNSISQHSNSISGGIATLNSSFTKQLDKAKILIEEVDDEGYGSYEQDLNDSVGDLSATPSTEELQLGGVDTLDQSVSRHERKLRQLASTRRPRLDSLPSDDGSIDDYLSIDNDTTDGGSLSHPNPSTASLTSTPQPSLSSKHHDPLPHVVEENRNEWDQDAIDRLHSSTHFFQQILPQQESVPMELDEIPPDGGATSGEGSDGTDMDIAMNSSALGSHRSANPQDESSTIPSAAQIERYNSTSSSMSGSNKNGSNSVASNRTSHSQGRVPTAPMTPTHDLIPRESAVMVPETPPAEVIKNPLEVPYLMTLVSNDAPWTMTIEGRHVPTSPVVERKGSSESLGVGSGDGSIATNGTDYGANPDPIHAVYLDQLSMPPAPPPPPPLPLDALDGPPTEGKSDEKDGHARFEEWLDGVVIGGEVALAVAQASSGNDNTGASMNKGGRTNTTSLLDNPLPRNRDLDTFLAYLKQRFHSTNSKPSTSKEAKQLQQRPAGSGIPVSSIVNACSEIECGRCRESAMEILNRIQESMKSANDLIQSNDTSKSEPKSYNTTTGKQCCLVLNPETIGLPESKSPTPEEEKEDELAVQAAFDYVALEEGNHVPLPEKDNPSNHEDDDVVVVIGGDHEPSVDIEKHIWFLPSSDSTSVTQQAPNASSRGKVSVSTSNQKGNKKNSSGQQKLDRNDELFIQGLSCEHVEDLIVHCLPSGTEEGALTVAGRASAENPQKTNLTALEPRELRDIQTKVLGDANSVRGTLDELEQLGVDLSRDFGRLVNSISTGGNTSSKNSKKSKQKKPKNLDVNAFPLMQDCDKKSVQYMERLVHIMTVTTSERSHALQDTQMRLWTSFLRALSATLQACDKYYTSLFEELADQQGVAPKMFVSAPHRKLYLALVEEKVKVWTELIQEFSSTLTHSVLKEWFTHFHWQDLRGSGGSTCSALSSLDDDEASAAMHLDDWCHDLVNTLSEWSESILDPMPQRKLMQQSERLLEQLSNVVEPLAREYATVERYFQAEKNRYFAGLRSNILLSAGVKKKMRLIDNKEIEAMAHGVILIWRHVRLMQSRMKPPERNPPLPAKLAEWMQSEDGVDDNLIDGFEWYSPNHPCLVGGGSGGKRRVMCILAGLVYQWLDDRCMEWSAELAEQELLTSMDDGIDFNDHSPTGTSSAQNAITGTKSKSSKRNKKRKDKNKASAGPSTLEPNNEGSNDTSETPKDNGEVAADTEDQYEASSDAVKTDVVTTSESHGTANDDDNADENETADKGDSSLKFVPNEDKSNDKSYESKVPKEESTAPTSELPTKEQTQPPQPTNPSPTDGNSSNEEEHTEEKTRNSGEPGKQGQDNTIIVDNEFDFDYNNYESAVGVVHLGKFTTAEEFLLGRFKELLKQAANGKEDVILY